MELISRYIEIYESNLPEEYRPPVPEEWMQLHHCTQQTIGILAGRGTGKSYNVAIRARNSLYDTVVFVRRSEQVRTMCSMIERAEGHASVIRMHVGGHSAVMELNNGKKIHILTFRGNQIRGMRFHDKEVIIDEFDNSDFSELVANYEFRLREARHIICIGSVVSREVNEAKQWFNQSEYKTYIDSNHRPPTRGHMPEEYRPSLLRQFMEHIPPLGALVV